MTREKQIVPDAVLSLEGIVEDPLVGYARPTWGYVTMIDNSGT